MNHDVTVLRDYFARLAIAPEIADIYLALHAYGAQTISELSRHAGVERTRIYRCIDDMAHLHLIEIETHYKRRIIKPAPINNLHILLNSKEEELWSLQKDLNRVQELLHSRAQHSPTTNVQFFKGSEGLKQLLWNQLRTKTENLSILYENIQGRTNSAFFERWVHEYNQRAITSKSIVSDNFITTQKKWYAKKDNERMANFEARYVPNKVFAINHSTVIYNDVVAYHSWHDGDVFGIELHNRDIANAHRQFFAMLWERAQPIGKDVSQQLKSERA